jgi:hypothetical protein
MIGDRVAPETLASPPVSPIKTMDRLKDTAMKEIKLINGVAASVPFEVAA